ncbi:MAG: hypothetical protein JWM11_4871 [Planctomycetaceae bacterium]|nr:hypothetical protein [Planctomycetaceae bacterium]
MPFRQQSEILNVDDTRPLRTCPIFVFTNQRTAEGVEMEAPDGSRVVIQIGLRNKGNKEPIARERRAKADLEAYLSKDGVTKFFSEVFFVGCGYTK